MSSTGPDDEQDRPPQWQQPQQGDPLGQDQPSWQQPQQQWGGQQQWGQPEWGQQQQQWQTGPRTPGSATAALVLGICGLVLCFPLIICAPLAIVFGNKAKREIDTSNGNLTGSGLATAGIVLGWIGVAIIVIGILIIIAAVASGS